MSLLHLGHYSTVALVHCPFLLLKQVQPKPAVTSPTHPACLLHWLPSLKSGTSHSEMDWGKFRLLFEPDKDSQFPVSVFSFTLRQRSQQNNLLFFPYLCSVMCKWCHTSLLLFVLKREFSVINVMLKCNEMIWKCSCCFQCLVIVPIVLYLQRV